MIYDDFLNIDELAAYLRSLNNRARNINVPDQLTLAQLRDRIFSSGGKCEWCGVDIVRQPFEIDHVTSLSNGGAHHTDNLVVSCPACNRTKASKHPARFAAEIAARTGSVTPLVQRILDQHGMEAQKQQSLFTDETDIPPPPINIEADDTTPDFDPPPYIWGDAPDSDSDATDDDPPPYIWK